MPTLALSPQDSVAKVLFSQYQPIAKTGISPFANLSTATLTLGTGIPVWQITKATAQKYGVTKLMPDLLISPTTYFYPISTNNTTVLLIRVDQNSKGAWVFGGVGFAALVNEIALANVAWPAPTNVMIIVENLVTKEYLFHLNNLSAPNLTRFRFSDNAPEQLNGVAKIKYQDLELPDAEVARTLQFAWR
jgi:hypothetical protein